MSSFATIASSSVGGFLFFVMEIERGFMRERMELRFR